VLVGATAPTAGEVRHPGATGPKPIGYLPQRVPFREGFTARETLAFYARLVGDDPDAALDRVGLGDAGDRRVEALSGGMRRLLGIAQAVLGDPLARGPRRAGERSRPGDARARVPRGRRSGRRRHRGRGFLARARPRRRPRRPRRGPPSRGGRRRRTLDRLLDEHGVANASELYRVVIGELGAPAGDEGEGPTTRTRATESDDGDDEGESDGDDEGESDGDDEGESDGDDEGESDGDDEGESDGDDEGESDGDDEGESDGDEPEPTVHVTGCRTDERPLTGVATVFRRELATVVRTPGYGVLAVGLLVAVGGLLAAGGGAPPGSCRRSSTCSSRPRHSSRSSGWCWGTARCSPTARAGNSR